MPDRLGSLLLRERDVAAVEEMDRPDCDPELLRRTYAQFPVVNAVVAGLRSLYRGQLRPRMTPDGPNTLLDIGCGGGDVARAIARWAARDGFELRITGIDPDARAHAFASNRQAAKPLPGLAFRRAFSSELVAEGARFDLVISNHVLHHLTAEELGGLLDDSRVLAGRAAVHADIARSPLAYALFGTGTLPFFHGSLIRQDGLTSIRRSYTPDELQAAVPPDWTVVRRRPFVNLLMYEPPQHNAPTSGPPGA